MDAYYILEWFAFSLAKISMIRNSSNYGIGIVYGFALVDPLHKVRQGGKGSVWDGRMCGRTDGHFQSTSGSLPVHLSTICGLSLVPDIKC